MQYLALATDYDGTLAHDSHVDEQTVAAVNRWRDTGRRVILVTGREIEELVAVCPHLKLFDAVVAENGGVLYWPETGQEEVLGKPTPEAFISEMNRQNVKPFSVGRTIFATWRPHETTVQSTIKRLGIDYHMIFNKHAIMVLPNDVTKATGLATALERLGITPSQVVGVGDAENDFSFLRACGASAAVANAIPELKDACKFVLSADHGQGVIELIATLLESDNGQPSPSPEPRQDSKQHR